MWAYAILIAVGIAIVLLILRGRYAIRVTLTSDGVSRSIGLTEPIRVRLDRFAQESMRPGDQVKLKGNYFARGRIRWTFPRSADPDFAQRLRNFMANEIYM